MQAGTSNRNRIALVVSAVAVVATVVVGGGAVRGAGALEEPTPSQPSETGGASTSVVESAPTTESPPSSQPPLSMPPPGPMPEIPCYSIDNPLLCDEEWLSQAIASGELVIGLTGAERPTVSTGNPTSVRSPAPIRVTG